MIANVPLFVLVAVYLAGIGVAGRFRYGEEGGAMYAVLLLMVLFMVGHEAAFDDRGMALKYALHLAAIAAALTVRFDVRVIGNVFVWAVSLICVFIVIQMVLLNAFFEGDVMRFEPVAAVGEVLGRRDLVYMNPFGLGFLRPGDIGSLGPVEWYRRASYATEPKYISQVILTSLATLFVCGPKGVVRSVLFVLHLFCLLLVSSFAGGFALMLSAAVYVTAKGVPRWAPVLVIALLVVGTFAGDSIFTWMLDNTSGFTQQRMLSAAASFALLTNMSFSWFGMGVGPAEAVDGGGATFLPSVVLLRFGVVGVASYLLLFTMASRAMLVRMRRMLASGDRGAALGIAIFVGIYFAFFVIIMPELVTPGLIFIFLIALRGTPVIGTPAREPITAESA